MLADKWVQGQRLIEIEGSITVCSQCDPVVEMQTQLGSPIYCAPATLGWQDLGPEQICVRMQVLEM